MIHRRWTDEFPLVLIAALLLIAGYVAAAINPTSATVVPEQVWRDLLVPLAGIAVCYAIWAFTRDRADVLILPACLLLMAIGMITMYRLQPDIGGPDGLGDLSRRHVVYTLASLLLMVMGGRWFPLWPYLRRYKYLIIVGSIGLLLLTLVAGRERYGAKLWIGVGPVEIQSSEFIKIGLILFLAAYLHEKHELMHGGWRIGRITLPPLPYLIPVAILLVVALLMVVAMNDLGSALLIFSTALAMLYVALRKVWYVLISLAIFAAGAWFAYQSFDRVGVRIQNWLDPWHDPFGAGYQQIQADYSMSAGGLLGTGIGRGEPWRIPAVHTDYVFAAIVEEWGLLGGLAIIAAFAVLLYRGLRIAMRADSLYDRYIAVGISVSIAIQAIVILGGVLRFLPLTGVTLPFVSAGGTSLLLNGLLVGMLLNLSLRQTSGSEQSRA